ncbi:hypothetical protein E2C01_000674 [Portunus trituberculatus]|uniref:Uncharacterized protein n=1 Tax=Portunus trituberculatus TaxID=210409 RepID=A0A5B7CFQ2_PORTR|nr:hypothetical protein [Portunus trituberculatus]
MDAEDQTSSILELTVNAQELTLSSPQDMSEPRKTRILSHRRSHHVHYLVVDLQNYWVQDFTRLEDEGITNTWLYFSTRSSLSSQSDVGLRRNGSLGLTLECWPELTRSDRVRCRPLTLIEDQTDPNKEWLR